MTPILDLQTGNRVVPGPDWKWGGQGGPNPVGTVIDPTGDDGWVIVRWDDGHENGYRNGCDGAQDLRLDYDDGRMTISRFRSVTQRTAVFPLDRGFEYATIGLADESGEVLGKLKKFIRGDTSEGATKRLIAEELGDVFWYAFALAEQIGKPVEEILSDTAEKLEDRQRRGVLKGDGDHR